MSSSWGQPATLPPHIVPFCREDPRGGGGWFVSLRLGTQPCEARHSRAGEVRPCESATTVGMTESVIRGDGPSRSKPLILRANDVSD